MAATPFEPLPGTSLFDVYADGMVNRGAVAPSLPDGQCNYVDLGPGANGAKCGCRRFWSRTATPRTLGEAIAGEQAVFCMCNHHACFHDENTGGTRAPAGDAVAGLENEKPRTGREPLSPLQDISLHLPSELPPPPVEPPTLANPGTHSFSVKQLDVPGLGQSGRASPAVDASLPDTLSWGDILQSQPGHRTHALPPIPSQCLMPSQPSSVAGSSQSRYLRPFAGRGLQTLSGVRNSKTRSALKGKPQDLDARSIVQRLPSLGENDDASAIVPYEAQPDSPMPPGSSGADTQTIGPYSGPSREAFKNLSDVVNGHEQRIDRLENVSFSAAAHEECQEKFDHTDLRVTELESRVEEVEKLVNDGTSQCASRANRHDNFDVSTCSVVSTSTNATARAVDSSEMFTQLRSLQSQVDKLQASLPSVELAWEVEVVFLPFPLRRVWQEQHDFKLESAAGMDEWTQMPNTCSAAATRAQSPFCGEWAGVDHEYEWLLPKAFGTKSIIDRRLRSRGLVKTISIKGPDARSVQMAMNSAFGGLLRDMAASSSQRSRRRSSTRSGQFLGLLQDWVPLRKMHKDSRLRFLSPSEMVTPATWDVHFLHSVVMKSSEPRLFVTQPEAYVQDKGAYQSGWTWQTIRELTRVYPDSQDSVQVPEADALEGHWNWNKQYDDTTNLPAPLKLRHSKTRLSSSPSQQFFTGVQSPIRSSSPFVSGFSTGAGAGAGAVAASSAKARRKPQPLHIRTASMPPSLPPPFSPSQSRRRIVSHGQERQTIPVKSSPSMSAVQKRRRTTRSPSRPRFTPRWSTKSPSPMLAQAVRSMTPFNYATPYSNAPPEPHPNNYNDQVVREHDVSEDEDINIYDDGEDEDASDQFGDDDDDESIVSVEMVTHLASDQGPDSLWQHLPEDEPWPGIEDQMSDGENVDPMFSGQQQEAAEDAGSDASSQPSEYPSTQMWNAAAPGDDAGFRIHEDEAGEIS